MSAARTCLMRACAVAAWAVAAAPLALTPRAGAGLRDLQASAQPDPVRVAVIVGSDSASAADFLRGVELGSLEASALARLLGRTFASSVLAADSVPAGRFAAVISFLDSARTATLAARLDGAGAILVNAGASSDALRRSSCARWLLHVRPSESMLRDARRMAPGGAAADSIAVLAWHGTLERFGAGELNDRYRSSFGVDATEDAWLGWLAVKIIAEAALRAASIHREEMLAHLIGEGVRFDGHKGKPLSFRSWDGQLRQPLYASITDSSGTTIVEVPADDDRSAAAAAVLDRLGDGPGSSRCQDRR